MCILVSSGKFKNKEECSDSTSVENFEQTDLTTQEPTTQEPTTEEPITGSTPVPRPNPLPHYPVKIEGQLCQLQILTLTQVNTSQTRLKKVLHRFN